MQLFLSIYIHIYIKRERERAREASERERARASYLFAVAIITKVRSAPAEPRRNRAAEFTLPFNRLGAVLRARVVACPTGEDGLVRAAEC